jgi:hypothetical protein
VVLLHPSLLPPIRGIIKTGTPKTHDLSQGTGVLDRGYANFFYEKALFVKTDVAVAPCGRVQLLSALRALCFYSHFQ